MSISENSSNISRFLGIDYGSSGVGLAIADEETRIAFTYKKLKNDKNLLQNLAEIISAGNVRKVIIGIPTYVNKKSALYEGEKLGRLIQSKIGVDVFYQDEMFTTKIAQANLIEKGIKGIKKYDDQEAARIILQEWLDRQ